MLDLLTAMLMTTNIATGDIPKPRTVDVVEVRVGCVAEDPHNYLVQEVGPLLSTKRDQSRTSIIHHLYVGETGKFAVIAELPNGLWCAVLATGDN